MATVERIYADCHTVGRNEFHASTTQIAQSSVMNCTCKAVNIMGTASVSIPILVAGTNVCKLTEVCEGCDTIRIADVEYTLAVIAVDSYARI